MLASEGNKRNAEKDANEAFHDKLFNVMTNLFSIGLKQADFIF
jgi:hypothetical protein